MFCDFTLWKAHESINHYLIQREYYLSSERLQFWEQ